MCVCVCVCVRGGGEREHEAQSTNGLFKGRKAHNVHATRSTQRKRKCERVGAWECCVVGACASTHSLDPLLTHDILIYISQIFLLFVQSQQML